MRFRRRSVDSGRVANWGRAVSTENSRMILLAQSAFITAGGVHEPSMIAVFGQ
jgi:hypothetical protein